MQVGIFYFLPAASAAAHECIDYDPIFSLPLQRTVGYVRSEVVDAETLVDALDMAQPRPGESVMNTHWIEGVA